MDMAHHHNGWCPNVVERCVALDTPLKPMIYRHIDRKEFHAYTTQNMSTTNHTRLRQCYSIFTANIGQRANFVFENNLLALLIEV